MTCTCNHGQAIHYRPSGASCYEGVPFEQCLARGCECRQYVAQPENALDPVQLLKAIRKTLPDGPACILGDAILHLTGSPECTAAYHGFRHA